MRDPSTSSGEQNRARIESLNEKLIGRMYSWLLKIDTRFDCSKFSEELLMLKITGLTIWWMREVDDWFQHGGTSFAYLLGI